MHRLEHRGIGAGGVDIGGGGEAEAALNRRAEIGQDVAEQVRGDDDVERVRRGDESRGHRVDMEACRLDVGKLAGDAARRLVPEHHRIFLRVRFRHRGELAAPRARLLEGEAQDAFDPGAGENGCLDRHLVRRADMHAPAGARIFAFGVLADAENVEVAAPQRTLDALEKAVRADVGVLREALADRQQQSVQRHRVRNRLGPTHRAEQNGVEATQCLDAVGRHHRAMRLAIGAGPREALALQRKSRDAGGLVQNLPGDPRDVDADAVAGNEGDPVSFHDAPRALQPTMT